MWGAVFLLAVAGTTVLAEPSLTFPEVARGPSRIVSGWEAEVGQLPHQLSLRMVSPGGDVSSCGGTIIHSQWGLTAAHCTAGRVTIVIRAGTVNLTQPSAIFETEKYYNHPLYNEAFAWIVQPNDIGLLEFGRALVFSDTIQPIRLQRTAGKDDVYENAQAVASGWGRTWTGGSSPENLNWVYLRITTNADCLAAFGGSSIIQASTICARGYNVTSQSTCQGDSGGPLTTIDIDGKVSQVGVTSFVSGTGCHTDFPAGFVRPGFYHEWFEQLTGINFDWDYEEPATTTAAPESEEVTTSEPESEEVTTAAPESEEATTPAPESSSSSESSQSSESSED
uniref:Protease n=1 Tax=Helicoverpa armigera TaxID=29058 RepID=B1NLE3_HELAM|nr:protease [Helicoverpa armigera]